MKKMFIIIIMMTIIVGFAFSGGNAEQEAGDNSDELYTLKIFANMQEITNSSQTPIGKIIKDKFNIELEYIPYTGDYREKLNLMLAAGDYPELLWIQRLDILKQYIAAGVAQPIDEYIDNMPNFNKRFEDQIPYWRLSGSDGKLYSWDSGVPQDTRMRVETFDIAIRNDVLEQFGYPELLSSDDYVEFLDKAIKANPETNGMKTLGMVFPGAEPWGLQGIVPILYEKGEYNPPFAGNNAVIWDTRKAQFVDYLKNKGVKESFLFMNKLYRKGLLSIENFTDFLPQSLEKLNRGQALAAWYILWPLNQINATLAASENPDLRYIKLPIQSSSQVAENQKRALRIETTRDFHTYIITDKAKYPERIMEVVDFIVSEEGQVLQQSGIEGVHYTIENGKRVPTQEMIDGMMNDPNYLEKEGLTSFDAFGRTFATAEDGLGYLLYDDPDYKDNLFTEDKVMKVYENMGWSNSMEWWVENGAAANTGLVNQVQIDPNSEYGILQNKLVEFRVKQCPNLIMEPENDIEFEALYNSILNEYEKLNPEKLIRRYNELYSELSVKLK